MNKSVCKPVILIVTIMFFLTTNSYSQFFLSHWIKPNNPNINDSVIIYDSIGLPSVSTIKIFDRVQTLNDSNIVISMCYYTGSGTTLPKTVTDSNFLHRLNAGIYHVILYSRTGTSYSDSICDFYPPDDSLKFSFTVSPAADVKETSISALHLYPNPTNDKLHFDLDLSSYDISVFDIRGMLHSVGISKKEIDVSTLPSGIYCLRFRRNDEMIIRRFLKE